ncbi:MAG: hypothetical protein IMY85_09900 [Chloroflexi bacterium]|nr:hypothetical protein [Chloroflexota bacterium]
MLCVILLLLTACGDSTAQFCEIAETSSEERNEEGVNEFYEQLEAVAPDEIKNDVTTLREGWKKISFPLGGGAASRPEEVSEAGQNVFEFVNEQCGFEGGVYLVMPEIGF